jgi:ferrous iron transport protein B
LMGHACAIPAIASTRIIRDPRERLTTILVLPLMTCSARIPTYALLLGAFFGHRSAVFRAGMFLFLYVAGVLSGLAASLILRRTATRGRSLPFIMEMPAYRTPQLSALMRHAARTGVRFVKDVGTTVIAASAVLWILLNVAMPTSTVPATPTATYVGAPQATDAKPIERSIAAVIGKSIEPITRAAGFDWRINVGLMGSFGARELMVGTLGVIMGVEGASDDPAPLADKLRDAKHTDGSPVYSTRTALALLAFFMLACQCLSTLAAIRRETKTWRWPAFVLVYTYAIAYVAAVVVYQVSGLVGVS